MSDQFDTWLFLAGLGVFLFGMHFMEVALNHLVGRSFKLFLRRQTTNPIKGILGGTAITGIVQSSSVVSLMVMAFIGAGILSMKSGLGIIFGSNLGTTLTGWIVAWIGFKLDIEAVAFPLVGLGGLAVIFFTAIERLYNFGRFIFGFGLLFIGLAWMKESIEFFAQNFDLTQFSDIHPLVYLLIGMVVTAIIQSSSAMMVITLSALSVNAISLETAMFIVIGSNIGTTSTLLLGAIKGTPAKKQLASGHVLFNVVTGVIAVILISPLSWLMTDILGIKDPIIAVVTFHTIFNLLGILLFLPFIGKFAQFLENRFVQTSSQTRYISKVPPEIPAAAVPALINESLDFIRLVINLNSSLLETKKNEFSVKSVIRVISAQSYLEKYEELKQLEGEIVQFSIETRKHPASEEEVRSLQMILHALGSTMQAAKIFKDLEHNIKAYKNSANETKRDIYHHLTNEIYSRYNSILDLIQPENEVSLEQISQLKSENHLGHNEIISMIYLAAEKKQLNEKELSTFLNVNREIYTANKSIIKAVGDLTLSFEDRVEFGKLPELVG